MKNRLLLLLCLFSTFSFSLDYLRYDKYGFSIKIPESWEYDYSCEENEHCIQKLRSEVFINGSFHYPSIIIEAFPSDSAKNNTINSLSAKKAFEYTKDLFKLENVKLYDRGKRNIDNIDIKWAFFEHDNGETKFNFKSYYFGWKNWIFRFTYKSDAEIGVFQIVKSDFEKAMKTLKMDR
ncbi:MAG: hypothetical protein MI810_09870 [Flavobacteriales bacterium]|nr:hypothetical protein [Flavobacteriales bacterium]